MKRVLSILGLAALLAVPAVAGDAKGCCARQQGVTRSVAKVDNGVRITMTSTDPKTVSMLQSKAPECAKSDCDDCPMHAEGVARSVETLADGVAVTATATNAALIAKLQEHATGAATCSRSDAKVGCCAKSGAAAAGCAPAHPQSSAAAGCAHGSHAAPATT